MRWLQQVFPKPNICRKQVLALEQASNLNYSNDMNILLSSVPPANNQMIYIVNPNNYIPSTSTTA